MFKSVQTPRLLHARVQTVGGEHGLVELPVAENVAEVTEVLLARSPFGEVGTLPVDDELLGGHVALRRHLGRTENVHRSQTVAWGQGFSGLTASWCR
jgi:hypothetical protein